jgi:hypothetical protein
MPNRGSAKAAKEGGTVNCHDIDSLRRLTREHHDQRVRQADAERLRRELRGKRQSRPWLLLTIGGSLTPRRRAVRPHFEA